MNVAIQMNFTMDHDTEVEISFHYNRLNNNQYTQMIRLPKMSICTFMEKYGEIMLTDKSIHTYTNFPIPMKKGDQFCPVPPVCFEIFKKKKKIIGKGRKIIINKL